ncbi:hypothetical protein RF11_13295 [Thelohanellus kitauei]|uniref:Uncharacterized protein n=1 Tax=Thelohanellus kitauei TaxID=669202 RepID=A0A0C2J5V0_THEKT|nr:hypothetical protein RF11_13295 [Thelohanellus kitauei]
MSRDSYGSKNISQNIHGTESLTNEDATDSKRLVIEEMAKEYLVRKFRTSNLARNLIMKFEPQIVEQLEITDRNWRRLYDFETTFYRFIFHRLCQYYGFQHFMTKHRKMLIMFCSPHQSLKKSISQLAQEAQDEISPVISTSETTDRDKKVLPIYKRKDRKSQRSDMNKYFDEDSSLVDDITEAEKTVIYIQNTVHKDVSYDEMIAEMIFESVELLSSSSEDDEPPEYL